MGVTGALRAAVELVLPRACAGCGTPATWWCAACDQALRVVPQFVVLPSARALPSTRCACAAPYRGPAGAALVAMKERGVVAALPPLAAALARAVTAVLPPVGDRTAVALVPAPSRPAVVRARGADVVAGLARACAAELATAHGWDARVVGALAHSRSVRDQAGLGPAERASNLAGAIRARPLSRSLLAGRVVVVVDDVLTTGATVREAVRALRALDPDAPIVAATVAGVAWSAPTESVGLLVSAPPDG
jgi:predicted amidophosphoribosyltransferase